MRRCLLALAALLVLGIGAGAGIRQTAKPPSPLYEYRAAHDPNGIGKFFMGREIAHVMGSGAADWLDRPEREAEEQPEKMLDALKLKPGDHVADVGAGSGYLTFRMAQRVGPTGLVYANDIQPEMLQIIRRRMRELKVANVKPILGTVRDPRLPPESVDLILLVDVYHEFEYPFEMMRAMLKALKPGGRIAFVEFRLEDENVPIKLVHKMSTAQMKREMAIHPVEWLEPIETLPWQHLFLVRKPARPQNTGS